MEPLVSPRLDAHAMLAVALEQARIGFAEGGVPVGGAVFHLDGTLLGAGRNRLVQEGNCSLHGETDAFRAAGRRILPFGCRRRIRPSARALCGLKARADGKIYSDVDGDLRSN